jgi:hypothetical protein
MLDPTVVERIQKGKCVICGKEDPTVVVSDIRYGKVKVCDTHNVAKVAIRPQG